VRRAGKPKHVQAEELKRKQEAEEKVGALACMHMQSCFARTAGETHAYVLI
jgi:hypothetical protein